MTEGRTIARLVRAMKTTERDPLGPLIDKYLLTRHRSPQRLRSYTVDLMPRMRPGGRLSPSTLGGCKRQAAFKFLNVRPRRKIDPDNEMVFEVGNWIHHMFNALFLDMELVLGDSQFKVLGYEESAKIREYRIAGWLDSRVWLGNIERNVVIDFKSIRDYGFRQVYDRNAPIDAHVSQLHSYMAAKQTVNGLIYYINKDDQRRKIYPVKFQPVIWNKTQEWCADTLGYMEEKQLPPMHPDCQQGNFLYTRCPWSHICYGERSDKQIRNKMYKNFVSVKRSWKEGNRIAG